MHEPDRQPMPSVSRANTGELVETLGRQVRALRTSSRWTLEELSKRSGVSIGLLSKIERGQGNPSFNTIAQLAHAFGVPIGRLFHSSSPRSPVVRRDERRALDIGIDARVDAIHELLTPSLDGGIEALWIEAPAGYDTSTTPFVHAGEEFGLILEGRHHVYLDGACHELGPGDSISYACTVPHWYRNPGPDLVRAVWVITPPNL